MRVLNQHESARVQLERVTVHELETSECLRDENWYDKEIEDLETFSG